MKTRRNHRKTTTGRRKRHVKHRVQTRINHRKGTVSSGRRHKFFKRGGQPQLSGVQNTLSGSVRNTLSGSVQNTKLRGILYVPTFNELPNGSNSTTSNTLSQPFDDILPKITNFVEGIDPNNVRQILVQEGFIDIPVRLTVIKADNCYKNKFNIKDFGIQKPVSIRINEMTVEFFINNDGCNVDIYVGETRYGRVRIKVNDIVMNTDICNPRDITLVLRSNAIIRDLIKAAEAAN